MTRILPVNLDSSFNDVVQNFQNDEGYEIEVEDLKSRRRDFAYSSIINLAQSVNAASQIVMGSCSRSRKTSSDYLRDAYRHLVKGICYSVGVVSPKMGNILCKVALHYTLNQVVSPRGSQPERLPIKAVPLRLTSSQK